MIEPIEYRGYKIWPDTKTIHEHNPISGHRWTRDVPNGRYYVAGPGARVTDTYKTIDGAKSHIDFLINYNTLGV